MLSNQPRYRIPVGAENATPGDVLGASSKGAGGNSVSRGGTGKEKRDKAIRFLNKKVSDCRARFELIAVVLHFPRGSISG